MLRADRTCRTLMGETRLFNDARRPHCGRKQSAEDLRLARLDARKVLAHPTRLAIGIDHRRAYRFAKTSRRVDDGIMRTCRDACIASSAFCQECRFINSAGRAQDWERGTTSTGRCRRVCLMVHDSDVVRRARVAHHDRALRVDTSVSCARPHAARMRLTSRISAWIAEQLSAKDIASRNVRRIAHGASSRSGASICIC